MPAKVSRFQPATVFTIGHSTRPIEEFIDLLLRNGVGTLVDVRTVPKSRHNPQYWGTALKPSLRKAKIGYVHMADLGGLRKPAKDSVNTGWRNRSFQGYADYTQTDSFLKALDGLMALARSGPIAIMCAEAVPWRCHRNLIADALTVRRFRVEHIMSPTKNSLHRVTPWAQVRGKRIIYAYAQDSAAQEAA